jgi:hypothetical protein
MNVNLASAKKQRPALDGGFSNDNNWLSALPVGVTFYCKWAKHMDSWTLQERVKCWEQGRVVRLSASEPEHMTGGPNEKTTEWYVDSQAFSNAFELVHVYKEEDDGSVQDTT